jgi:hypothetical protein
MLSRTIAAGLIVLSLAMLCAAQTAPAEKRMQAILGTSSHYESGGMKVTKVFPNLPATKLTSPDGKIVGSLAVGDLIIEINGQKFRDQREYLDLLNESFRLEGKIRITVKSPNSKEPANWVLVPTLAEVEVPASKLPAGSLPRISEVPPETPKLSTPTKSPE